jgi:phosphotriesterase-related protein
MAMLTRRDALQLMSGAAAAAVLGSSASAQAPAFPKGAVIRTLFKDYAPEELAGGATLFHEHLSLGTDFGERFRAASAAVLAAQGLPTNNAAAPPPPPAGPDPMRDIDLMAEELRAAQHDGVACLVDAGLEGSGVDLEFIRAAAKKSGVPVVKGAGFYVEPFYPKEIAGMSEEQLVHALVRQADTYPAGVFGEIGSWDEISKVERKVFRAVGKAHVATNLPIFTHTGIPGKSAIEQLDILEDAGVDPRRVAIGHLGNLTDPNVYVHKTLCRRGAFIGFDRQGGRGDAPVVPLVMALLNAGFADHVLISGDASRSYGKPLTAFLPQLKAAGADDVTLRRITVDNPRRFLAFVPKKPRKA